METFRYRMMGLVMLAMAGQPVLAQQAGLAAAKDYPLRPIRIVIPYGAGAGPDVVGRMFAQKIVPSLGQNFVFENRGGAGGTIGTALVAKAPPDGYTLLLQTANYASYPVFIKNLPYDPADLISVSLLARTVGFLVVVNPSLPVRSIKELIALAKAHPGKLNHGTSSEGVPAELFAKMAGVKLTAVRYKGVAAFMNDVISGQIEIGFPAAPSGLPFAASGRLRVLAITGEKRWNRMPDVPTVDEAGLRGYKREGWYGLWFPLGTPAQHMNRIQEEVNKAARDPELRQRFDEQGLIAVGSSSRELEQATREEFEVTGTLWASLGRAPQ